MAIWKQRLQSDFINGLQRQDVEKLPDLIQRLLLARGLDQDQISKVLNPKLSLLADPFAIKGMDLAVSRLVRAFKNNEKICIYADFDLDGASGLGILKDGFENLGFKEISFYQPKRLSEGYGFHPHAVEELHHLGIQLIVTVDVGITSHAAFNKARELGLDVILTDHHLPSETLPDAYCVVNPNQKDCASGLKYLCGAGVAFYLIRALKRAFSEDSQLPNNDWDLKDLLDLFCIGTLTDMVPLVDDNRVLVKHGMVALQNTKRPGLKALLTALDLSNRVLSSQDVSIKFAPKLNALSRMESNILPVHIYLEKDMKKAEQMVDQILQNNTTRQSLQSDAEGKAFELLKNWTHEDFVFVSSKDFHRGVIGLIATKLSQEFNRPAFVGSENSEGMIVGSSRLPSGHDSSLVEALNSAGAFLNRFGGHSAAAGFELHSYNTSQFMQALASYYESLKYNHKELEIDFDTTAVLSEINSQFMKWYDHIGPYGVGFVTPILRFNNMIIDRVSELKGGHLKLQLIDCDADQNAIKTTDKVKIDALLFSPSEKIRSVVSLGEKYDVLGEVQKNYFKNRETIQILIKDLKNISIS